LNPPNKQSIPSFVRFYRDYSIADFAFSTFFTLVGAYAAFRTSVRAVVCEELSRQPDLMRGMAEMGLNLENCELWFERAVMAFMVFMVVLTVVRVRYNPLIQLCGLTLGGILAVAFPDCISKLLLPPLATPRRKSTHAHTPALTIPR
jgi:hypothetical protein